MKIFTLFFAWVLLRGYIRRQKHAAYRRALMLRPGKREAQATRERRYYAANRGLHNARARSWSERHVEKRRKAGRDWCARNATRLNSDPVFKLKKNFRNRVRHALMGHKIKGHKLELLGCSVEALKSHLEKLFTSGMSWTNYGKWHIDHKRPCDSFDLSDPLQQKVCFHYTNLQPLWAFDNLSKGAKCGN